MPRPRLITAALCVAVGLVALAGCGGDDAPDPSLQPDDSQTLLATLQEVEANIEVGSCFVAADKVEELRGEIADLPSTVDADVLNALEEGTDRLATLVPAQCEGGGEETTTTEETVTEEPTTTEETTTEETTTEETTTQETQTTPTTPTTPGGGGGIAPGDGL